MTEENKRVIPVNLDEALAIGRARHDEYTKLPPEEARAAILADREAAAASLRNTLAEFRANPIYDAMKALAKLEPRLKQVYKDNYLGTTVEDNRIVIKLNAPIPEMLQEEIDNIKGLLIESVAAEQGKNVALR